MIFKSDLAGIVASAIVMVVPTFELGYFDVIYSRLLTPSTIATPIVLGGILSTFHGNLLIGVILCCLSTFVQPLIGLEMGGLLLLTYSFHHFIEGTLFSRKTLAHILLSLFILGRVFLYFAVPQFSQEKINTDFFIYTMAHFRHPHHYIPSTFTLFDYAKGVVFLTAVLVISHRLIRLQNNPYAKYSAIFIYSTIFVCIGGYIFVELIPIRLWVTAQVFRLLFFVKWVGLILLAGMLVETGTERTIRKSYLPFIFNAVTISAILLSEKIMNRFKRESKLLYVPAVILLFILLINKSISITSIAILSCFVMAIYLVDLLSLKQFAAASLSILLLFIVLVFTHKHIPGAKGLRSLNRLSNSIKLDYNYETYKDRVDVEKYALLNTPAESVFLTPPNWGEFRILARRAIVVDFKAFPFSDKAMEEWYNRMLACYGNPRNHGFHMIDEMNEKYKDLNDETLKSLRKKYKFSYAVLYEQTPTKCETLYKNEKFKIVSLQNR